VLSRRRCSVMAKRQWRLQSPLRQGALIGVAAALLVVAIVFFSWLLFGGRRAHDLAEALGGIGSMVAAGFVALTLWMQSRELRLQRRELELQRFELRLTRQEFERHRVELQRQGDILAQQAAKDMPRLCAAFAWRGKVGERAHFSLRIKNLGGAAITNVKAKLEGDAGQSGPDHSPSVSPNQHLNVAKSGVHANSREEAFAAFCGKASRVHVTFTDAMGSPRAWSFDTQQLAGDMPLYFPEASPEDPPVGEP
jgi:hypothetical protein